MSGLWVGLLVFVRFALQVACVVTGRLFYLFDAAHNRVDSHLERWLCP